MIPILPACMIFMMLKRPWAIQFFLLFFLLGQPKLSYAAPLALVVMVVFVPCSQVLYKQIDRTKFGLYSINEAVIRTTG